MATEICSTDSLLACDDTKAALAVERLIGTTTSLCSKCKNGINADIIEVDGRIIMRKTCPSHGTSSVMLSSDAAWYHEILEHYPPIDKVPTAVKKDILQGCPFDCGTCSAHKQKTYISVVPVTSMCNQNCHYCYTHNKNEEAYFLSLSDFSKMLEHVARNDPDLKIINFTGGEPTCHPLLTEFIRTAQAAGVHRITLSTNGLMFLQREEMLAELASLNVRVVLSFHSFSAETWRNMTGHNLLPAKLKVLDLLEKYNVNTTLIPVIAKDCNDTEIGRLVALLLEKPFIRSLEFHSMTFTGQGGRTFRQGDRLTPPEILDLIESSARGKIRRSDFVPSPCAHPLCYQTCYLLEGEREFIPFTRFMSKSQIRYLLEDNLYIEPSEKLERTMQDVMMNIWAKADASDADRALNKQLKGLIQRIFPERPLAYAEQQAVAERAAKTIYLHSHMDEDNFDTERLRHCCVNIPEADGSNRPACSYNVLYREQDHRFGRGDCTPVSMLKGGKFYEGDSSSG